MKRRVLLAGGAAALLSPLLANAAATARPYRIFMLLFRGETAVEKGFRDYLQAQNVPFELIVRDIEQDVSRIPALLAEARAGHADLLYTWGTPVTLAVLGPLKTRDPARHVTDIPVVFTMVSSPVAAGLVEQSDAQARNFTGAVHVVPLALQLGAMRAYRPFRRLAVIYNPAEVNSRLNLQQLQHAAAQDGFELVELPVPLDVAGQPLAAALPALLTRLARRRPDFLYLGPDTFLAANRTMFTEAAVVAGLPIFAATEIAIRDGKALFGLVSPYEKVGQLTACKALQILRDKRAPHSIPIETLGRFSYLVNMSVAAELEFYPPLKVVNYAELLR